MAHSKITVTKSSETVGVFKTSTSAFFTVTKLNNGLAVAGYYTYGNNLVGCILVSQTENATYMTGGGNTATSFTYDSETWYYQNLTNVLSGATPATPAKSRGAAYGLGNYTTLPTDVSDIAEDLLDYYFSGNDIAPNIDFQNGFAIALALNMTEG